VSYIDYLRLTDFRSYDSLDIKFDGRPVVFFGPNGAGKTNLLEAISFLSPGRGLRRAKIEELSRLSSGKKCLAWGVNADLNETRVSIGQIPENPKRRATKINGKNTTGTELANLITLMWLTPMQDRLFTGPSADRRKFLDRFTLVHSPSHGLTTLRYEKMRSERNRLLSEGISDKGWFEVIENDMARQGASIAKARTETVIRLNEEIDNRSKSNDNFPKGKVSLEGSAEEKFKNGMAIQDVEDYLREELKTKRPLDMKAGRTLNGVHKTDLSVVNVEKNMVASQCSTGEQKALLIGLTLAHARAQADKSPILLLDEVAAHLDIDRRAALIEELVSLGTQLFMTGTDALLFEAFKDRAQQFEIKNSKLTKYL